MNINEYTDKIEICKNLTLIRIRTSSTLILYNGTVLSIQFSRIYNIISKQNYVFITSPMLYASNSTFNASFSYLNNNHNNISPQNIHDGWCDDTRKTGKSETKITKKYCYNSKRTYTRQWLKRGRRGCTVLFITHTPTQHPHGI